jgi:hypothetical protein
MNLDWLDGAMVLLAIYTLNIFHPGFLLGNEGTVMARERGSEIEKAKTPGSGSNLGSEPELGRQ